MAMMPPRSRAELPSILLICILAQAPLVRAETLVYGADVGIGESDNITLVRTHRVSQTIAVAQADFELKQQGRLYDVDAKGNFTELDFLQHAYGNELIGRFDGLAHVALIPERLSWALQEDFGQSQIDPFAAVTPNNRENVNYVSTGPDATLRLGSVGFVDMTARYARTDYAKSPFNNQRLFGSVAAGTQISQHSSVSLNGTTQRVLFDNTVVNSDYDRSSVYGHYEAHGARTDLSANLGATRVNQGSFSSTGALAKLKLSRKMSSSATLNLEAGRDITDASTSFGSLQSGAIGGVGSQGAFGSQVAIGGIGTLGTTPAALTSSNYTITYGSAGWQYKRDRTTINLNGRWERDAYKGQPQFDLTRENAELSIERQLTRALSAQVLGSLYHSAFTHVDFADRDAVAAAALIYREGRGLEIRLHYDHVTRAVSGIGTGYAENRVFLTVGFRPRLAPT